MLWIGSTCVLCCVRTAYKTTTAPVRDSTGVGLPSHTQLEQFSYATENSPLGQSGAERKWADFFPSTERSLGGSRTDENTTCCVCHDPRCVEIAKSLINNESLFPVINITGNSERESFATGPFWPFSRLERSLARTNAYVARRAQGLGFG